MSQHDYFTDNNSKASEDDRWDVWGIVGHSLVYSTRKNPNYHKVGKTVTDVEFQVELIPQEVSDKRKPGEEFNPTMLIVENFYLCSRDLTGCIKMVEEYATNHCSETDGIIIMELIETKGLRHAKPSRELLLSNADYAPRKESLPGDYSLGIKELPKSSKKNLKNDSGCKLYAGVLSNPGNRRYGPKRKRKRVVEYEQTVDFLIPDLMPSNYASVMEKEQTREFEYTDPIASTQLQEMVVPDQSLIIDLTSLSSDSEDDDEILEPVNEQVSEQSSCYDDLPESLPVPSLKSSSEEIEEIMASVCDPGQALEKPADLPPIEDEPVPVLEQDQPDCSQVPENSRGWKLGCCSDYDEQRSMMTIACDNLDCGLWYHWSCLNQEGIDSLEKNKVPASKIIKSGKIRESELELLNQITWNCGKCLANQ